MSQLSPEGEIANRFNLVSRMADDLAHEIKNPLNSMVINLEVIRSRAKKGDAAGVLDRADVLESEVRRLNGLIDGLLKLLRPERSGSQEVYIDAVLTELVDLVGLQARLARKKMTFAALGEAVTVNGRRDAIRFAMLNILAAELDALTGENASLDVSGGSDADHVHVLISSRSAGASPAATAARATAMSTAKALLSHGGGTVDVEDGGSETGARVVTVSLLRERPA